MGLEGSEDGVVDEEDNPLDEELLVSLQLAKVSSATTGKTTKKFFNFIFFNPFLKNFVVIISYDMHKFYYFFYFPNIFLLKIKKNHFTVV